MIVLDSLGFLRSSFRGFCPIELVTRLRGERKGLMQHMPTVLARLDHAIFDYCVRIVQTKKDCKYHTGVIGCCSAMNTFLRVLAGT